MTSCCSRSRAVQLQVGAGSFDPRLLVVATGLLQVGALEHADNLAFCDLLPWQNLQCEHTATDRG
jgi:hypothetical protein